MYTLNLTQEQQEMLIELLECSLSEIHSEIVHTDNWCFKDILKHRKQVMQELLQTLNQIQPKV
jgi:hypothetical protein